MHCFKRVFLLASYLAVLILFGSNESLACSDILLVSNNSHFAIVHRIEAVVSAQPAPRPKLKHLILENTSPEQLKEKTQSACLIVSIGSDSLTLLLKAKVTQPILSILVRKNFIHKQLALYERSFNDSKSPITAIYLDQPLERQIQLLKALFGHHDKFKVGVLLGPHSSEEEYQLESLARKYNFLINLVYVNKLENPVAVFDALLNDTQAVLAIPDGQIYNQKTSRGILLTAFHKRIPLIAYSRTYVNNGALCAVYSTTKQIADQTASTIIKLAQKKHIELSKPQYPEDFSIAVNYQVAQSLGLHVEREPQIIQTIYRMEASHG